MGKSGRIVGMLVFLLGIVILLMVLGVAYTMFTSPAPEMAAPGAPVTAGGLGTAVVWILTKIALLFIMTLAASSIASRGIQLFIASKDKE